MPGQASARRILVPGKSFFAAPRASACGLLVDARDYYVAFYRAALAARHSILVTGWQFDRGVKLLRGSDVALAKPMGGEVRFLAFLDQLCKRRPALQVYILAWDFHVVLALEREWMQRLYFHWATNERLRFRFDASHVASGCHHQKFVVIDGEVSFLGGIDLCEARWDDRRHRVANRLRLTRGKPQKPYHDVQAYLRGAATAAALEDVFCDRWRRAGGDPIALPHRSASASVARAGRDQAPRGALPFPPGPVALSRTDIREKGARSKHEIRTLLVRAFDAAERLIYVETQYFSSRVLCEALVHRLRQARRPKLDIVLLVNERAEAVKEEIAVGLRQVQIVADLRRTAAETGHAFNAYFSLADGRARKATYIHSKLMIVDDRFLTVGSANFTNRSLGVDSEINVSWETAAGRDRGGEAAIQRTRISLLAEHIGNTGTKLARRLAMSKGLVGFLDGLVQSGRSRLRALPPPTPGQSTAIALLDPRVLPFDPERPD